MPRRTREHQLEGESRLAFERALGSRFVFRSEDPDYGVDGSVEEFDTELGQATGLRFFAQLKATDEAVLAKALHARISLETADYYRALSLPLLMVRYHAPTNRTFTRWFHQFDPYFGGLGDKGLTFRWVESDVWDGQRPERLVADVQAFLRWRSPVTPSPRNRSQRLSGRRGAGPKRQRNQGWSAEARRGPAGRLALWRW